MARDEETATDDPLPRGTLLPKHLQAIPQICGHDGENADSGAEPEKQVCVQDYETRVRRDGPDGRSKVHEGETRVPTHPRRIPDPTSSLRPSLRNRDREFPSNYGIEAVHQT